MFPIAAVADFNPHVFSKHYPDEDDDGKAHTQPLLKKGRMFLILILCSFCLRLACTFSLQHFRTRCFECFLVVWPLTFTSRCVSVSAPMMSLPVCVLILGVFLQGCFSLPLKSLLHSLSLLLSA